MLFDSCCGGGLRALMVNDSALVETPLQMQSVSQNLEPYSHWHDKAQVEANKTTPDSPISIHFSASIKSPLETPACFNTPCRVPVRNSVCMGTTQPESPIFNMTWLPFCLDSSNPIFLRAAIHSLPLTRGSLGICHFESCHE